jgi:precorrin-3B synthase
MKRGWCPSLFRPMESGDGWLVRVRPRDALLTAEVLQAVADAAARYGNGLIEITNRANLQIRGLQPDSLLPFTDAMRAVGIDEADERRNLLVSPLLGADATIAPQTAAIARAIAEGLGDEAFADLPGKFGVLIDGGGLLPLTGMSLDVTLRATAGGWTLQGEAVPAEDAARRALALARQAGHVSPRRTAPLPALGRYGTALLFAPQFGQIRAETLSKLADLALREGDGALRPTPWKSFAMAGVRSPLSAQPAVAALGLITDPADPRLGIVTCAGAPACLRGELLTHDTAAALAACRLPHDPLWHVSGCVKGCAHPGPAAVTLVGNYRLLNLIRDGTAGDLPERRALTLAETLKLMQSVPA